MLHAVINQGLLTSGDGGSPHSLIDCVACAGRVRTFGHYRHICVDDARIGNKGSRN